MFISFCDSVPGDSLVFHQKIEASYVFDWEYGIALHAVQGNRASFPSERSEEHTSELQSQDEKNTDVTTIMQNRSVYIKSTRDEAHFPFIGSIAIPCSTEYSTSGLTYLRKLQRFSETPASSLHEYSFQHSSAKKVPCTTYRLKIRADSLSLTEEVSKFSTSTSSGVFPQQ